VNKPNSILSEHTAELSPEEREKLRLEILQMSEDELKVYRNSVDPDKMGFSGEEGTDE
jgi:hypothetical protein